MKSKIFFLMSILIMLITASCVTPKTTTQKPKPTIPIAQEEVWEASFDSSKLVFLTVDMVIKNEWGTLFLTMPNKQYHLSDSVVLRYVDEKRDTVTVVFPKYSVVKCFDIDTTGSKMFVTSKGNSEKFLVYGMNDPDKKNHYGLLVLAKEKAGNYVMYGDVKFKVIYGINSKLMINPEVFKANHKRLIEGKVLN